MQETIVLKVEPSAREAKLEDEIKKLRQALAKLVEKVEYNERYLFDVALAPDERIRAINAGYGW